MSCNDSPALAFENKKVREKEGFMDDHWEKG